MTKKDRAIIKAREQHVWECKRCGRKSLYKFYEHATSRIANDLCEGRVRRIKWKNAW